MNVRLAETLGVWIVACAALAAADFWEEKDFTAWSDKEVEKMLTDSPWSRNLTIVLRGPAGGGGGGRGRRAGAPPRGGGDRFDLTATSRRMTLTVSWRSALPVKQALVRGQVGVDARIPPEQQQFLAQSEPFYVVAVSSFPRQFSRLAQDPAVMTETVLNRKNKDPISPDDIRIFRDGESVVVMYFFPKTDVIALDDKDVEFITKLGQIEIKKKFKLKNMVFGDQLTL